MTWAALLLGFVLSQSPAAPTTEEVRAFAAAELPELDTLLTRLEKSPGQYRVAIRDLSRQYIRFQKLKDHGASRRYERELERWKLDARVQIAAARATQLASRPDDRGAASLARLEQSRAELRAAVRAKAVFETRLLEERQAAIREELKTIDAKLQRLGDEAYLDREVERLTRAATAASRRHSRPRRSEPQSADRSTAADAPAADTDDVRSSGR